MELADVTDSKSVGSNTVWVRPPSPVPKEPPFYGRFFWYLLCGEPSNTQSWVSRFSVTKEPKNCPTRPSPVPKNNHSLMEWLFFCICYAGNPRIHSRGLAVCRLSLGLPSENFQFKFKTHRVIPMGLEFILKVFGSGFGRKPFYRKVSPDNTYKHFMKERYRNRSRKQ